MAGNEGCASLGDESEVRATRGLLMSMFVRIVVYMFVFAIMCYFSGSASGVSAEPTVSPTCSVMHTEWGIRKF